MEAKKNNKAFFAVCSVIVAVLLVVALAASIVMPLLSSTMNTYLGRGDRYTVQIEGAENWNTKYYDQKYTDTDSETGSVSYGLQVSKLITDEGEVLLKNDGLLPIAKGTKVTPFGWRYLSPIYGGTGSGNVDASKDYIVTAERGLANFAVNDTVVKALKGAAAKAARALPARRPRCTNLIRRSTQVRKKAARTPSVSSTLAESAARAAAYSIRLTVTARRTNWRSRPTRRRC